MRTGFIASVARSIRAAASARAVATTDGKLLVAAASARHDVLPLAMLRKSQGASAGRGNWLPVTAFLSAAAVMAQDPTVQAAERERTFIAIKPDGVQRGLIAEIIARFERKGYKLVAVKLVTPSKAFAEQHYDDLKERPFFNSLTDFLSSGPVLAMVWEGQGVIKYGRKLIGATAPQASEPGTIRGDLAISVGRNIIHGSDGPETAQAEIGLWFKPEELTDYKLNSEKWLYE